MKRLLIILIMIFITSCTYIEEIKTDITGETVVEDIEMDEGSIEVYFCPRDDCEGKLVNLIQSSEKIHCALFELNLKGMIDSFKGKDYFIIIDDKNYDEDFSLSSKPDNRQALMHNKFCIFDDKTISTGSFNPTVNGNTKNNNNFVIIYSEILAKNYEEEFKGF